MQQMERGVDEPTPEDFRAGCSSSFNETSSQPLSQKMNRAHWMVSHDWIPTRVHVRVMTSAETLSGSRGELLHVSARPHPDATPWIPTTRRNAHGGFGLHGVTPAALAPSRGTPSVSSGTGVELDDEDYVALASSAAPRKRGIPDKEVLVEPTAST